MRCRLGVAAAVSVALLAAGCAIPGQGFEPARTTSVTPDAAASSALAATAPSASATPREPVVTCTSASQVPVGPTLVGDTRNTWAFAPLSDPSKVVVEGSVPTQRAWSTSKVLVIAAFLSTVAHGDPTQLSAEQATWVERALTESDMPSLLALRRSIPGGSSAPMNAILRSVGDTQTWAPGNVEGTMQWTVRNQVRFMAAMAAGRVVNAAVSRYILERMHPIPSQSWGLATVHATAVKGGWLRPDTETRQMGILDGYAVAVVTAGVGPAAWQSDGDAAHVEQLNTLARMLDQRLTAEKAGRRPAASGCN